MLKRAPFTGHVCLSRGMLQCSLANKPHTELWIFHAPICLFYPFPAVTHCHLPSRKSGDVCRRRKSKIGSSSSACKVIVAYLSSAFLWSELDFPEGAFFQLHPAAKLQTQWQKSSGNCLLLLHLTCCKLYYQAYATQWSWIWVFMPIYLLWFMWHWSSLYNRVNVRVLHITWLDAALLLHAVTL